MSWYCLPQVNVLQSINHPHIISFYDFFVTRDKYYLVLELCGGGELLDKIVEKVNKTAVSDVCLHSSAVT